VPREIGEPEPAWGDRQLYPAGAHHPEDAIPCVDEDVCLVDLRGIGVKDHQVGRSVFIDVCELDVGLDSDRVPGDRGRPESAIPPTEQLPYEDMRGRSREDSL